MTQGRFTATNTGPYPESTQQFRDLIDDWAKKQDRTLGQVFKILIHLGKTDAWVRERYYGRAKVSPADLSYINTIKPDGLGQFSKEHTAEAQLKFYRQVVANMCRVCASAGDDKSPKCWDAMCPLRPISPLELKKSAHMNPPLGNETWD